MSPIRTTLARALAYLVLFVGVPLGTAVATTHHMLNGTEWTDPERTKKPRPATKPAPEKAAPSPKPRSSTAPWRLGECVTSQLQIIDCAPGALQVVGSIRDPGRRPCADLPETTQVRPAGKYALCLTDY
ncbi:hypothetical protein J8N05_19940 [Streptomyces sp. BH-SS-21]|uniref:Uncharacterized protein n=1 Tax=Streptomyces liliiviolaceus TaxID=2823109 RepID=A0A940Y172_9ACTN|nr:hypothetical protein [Streptomyces liliiviolaceus]MBQ0850455.1 hypothetical protein [Streptomyces liliiviolaceus]